MATDRLIDKPTALAELRSIARRTAKPDGFREVEALIDRIFDPRTLTHELSITGIPQILTHSGRADLIVSAGQKDAYDALEERLVAILKERGYADDIRTFQEHRLLASTVSMAYGDRPYTPIGILEGKLTLEQA